MRLTSSSPVAVRTAHREQSSGFTLLRKVLSALLFELGLCRSGRHFQPDRSARAMCCNGWRHSWSWLSINGNLTRIASWRPVTVRDRRFPWELEPAGKETTARFPSIAVFPNLDPDSDNFSPPDYSTEQRLERLGRHAGISPRLSLIDAHMAAGGVKP